MHCPRCGTADGKPGNHVCQVHDNGTLPSGGRGNGIERDGHVTNAAYWRERRAEIEREKMAKQTSIPDDVTTFYYPCKVVAFESMRNGSNGVPLTRASDETAIGVIPVYATEAEARAFAGDGVAIGRFERVKGGEL